LSRRPTTTRTFWGIWSCTSCDKTSISGELKACPACGNPREKDELAAVKLGRAVDPTTGRVLADDAIRDPQKLSDALAGPDWSCTACGSGNRAGALNCKKCGGPNELVVAAAHMVYDFAARRVAPEAERESRPSSSSSSPPKLPPPRLPPDLEPDGEAPRGRPAWFAAALGTLTVLVGTPLLLLAGYGLWWAFQTHDANGVVTGLRWEQRIYVDNWQVVTKEDWRDSLSLQPTVFPKDGKGEQGGVDNIRSCRDKWHHDRRYACGTTRECRPATRQVKDGETCQQRCSTRSNGNGSFTETCRDVCSPRYRSESYTSCKDETKYCTEAVTKKWCSYDTWVWNEVDKKVLSGTDDDPRWPTVTLGPLDRLRRDADYRVDVAYTDAGEAAETYTSSSTEAEFRTWHKGDPAIVAIFNLGAVADVRHPASVERDRVAP